MAEFTASSAYPFRMDQIDVTKLWTGTDTEKTDTRLTVDIGGGYVEHFAGFGVIYDGFGNPGTGTITGIFETYQGNVTYALTGVNTSAASFSDWVKTDDTLSALYDLFKGDDNLTGSRATTI